MMDKLDANSLKGKKLEVDVQLSDEHYIAVSSFINGQPFHGILIKNPNNVNCGVQNVPFGINDDKFEEWKNFISNNFKTANDSLWSGDSDKISSLYLRQTNFDKSRLLSSRNSDVFSRRALGVRRLDSRPVRLRPVAGQRNTVLCAKCQMQRVTTPLPRSARFTLNTTPSSSSRCSQKRNSTANRPEFAGGGKLRKREYPYKDATAPSEKMSKTDAQLLVQQLAANKKQILTQRGGGRGAADASNIDGSNPGDTAFFAKSSTPPRPVELLTPPPPLPPLAAASAAPLPRVPTLKITFGKRDSKTFTVINGRRPSLEENNGGNVSATSSSLITTPTKHWKKALMLQESESTSTALPNPNIDTNAKRGDEEIVAQTSASPQPAADRNETGEAMDADVAVALPHDLKLNDFVWAKMRSYPYWPARIYDVQDRQACVTWCASNQYGYVDAAELEPFVLCFNKRYQSKRPTPYQKAVADAVCHFADVFQNAYYASLLAPACRKLVQQQQRKREPPARRNVSFSSECNNAKSDNEASSSSATSTTSGSNLHAKKSSENKRESFVDAAVSAERSKTSEMPSPVVSDRRVKSHETKNYPLSSTPKREKPADREETSKIVKPVVKSKSSSFHDVKTPKTESLFNPNTSTKSAKPRETIVIGEHRKITATNLHTKFVSTEEKQRHQNQHNKSSSTTNLHTTKSKESPSFIRDVAKQPKTKIKHELDYKLSRKLASAANPNTKSSKFDSDRKSKTPNTAATVQGVAFFSTVLKQELGQSPISKSYKIPLRSPATANVTAHLHKQHLSPIPAEVKKNQTPPVEGKKNSSPEGVASPPVVVQKAPLPQVRHHSQKKIVSAKSPVVANRSNSCVFESESESDDDHRLVIDEMAEESFETFEKRRLTSSNHDEDESRPMQVDEASADVVAKSSLPAHHNVVSGRSLNLASTAAGKTSGGGDVDDFDSVLSELQEMNDMCAAGSNSLLTTC